MEGSEEMRQFNTIDGAGNGFLFTLAKDGTYSGYDLSGQSLVLDSSDLVFQLARIQGIKVLYADGKRYEQKKSSKTAPTIDQIEELGLLEILREEK